MDDRHAAGAIAPDVLPRNSGRAGVDVARQHRPAQRPGRGDRQHAGAGADVQHAQRTSRLEKMVERQQASPRRAVMSGAEGEGGADLDADAVEMDARAVVLAVDDEASGLDRREPFLARLDPVFRRERLEGQRIRRLGPGREPHQRTDGGLVGRIVEVDRDRPTVAGIIGGYHGLRRVEDFCQPVEQVAGGVCAGVSRATTVGPDTGFAAAANVMIGLSARSFTGRCPQRRSGQTTAPSTGFPAWLSPAGAQGWPGALTQADNIRGSALRGATLRGFGALPRRPWSVSCGPRP